MLFHRVFTCSTFYLIFTIFVESSSSKFGLAYEGYPIQDCAEDPTYYGYCVDCATQVDCMNGVQAVNNTCTDFQGCQVKSVYSACSDINEVPDCSCPQNGTVQKPDPYDDTKFLVCSDGDRHMFQCPDGLVYQNETESCYHYTTSFPNGCPGDVNTKIILNCTCYRFCFDDGTFSDSCCAAGDVYNDADEQCEAFEFFSCAGRDDGMYVDNHNCSTYHICVNGEQFATEYCPDGLTFNETSANCEEGDCDEIPDCGVCPNDQTFFKIDCYNYYDCQISTESWDPEFIPVPGYCPEGTCFNEETGSCEESITSRNRNKNIILHSYFIK